jgi:serine/threonine protein kinase
VAPEVIELKGITFAADIWSLGCVVVELITLKPPYSELQSMSALFRIVQDPHPPLPESISSELRSFLLSCFKKEPKERETAKQLLDHPFIKKYKFDGIRQNAQKKLSNPKLAKGSQDKVGTASAETASNGQPGRQEEQTGATDFQYDKKFWNRDEKTCMSDLLYSRIHTYLIFSAL